MTNPSQQPPPRRKRPSVEDGAVGVSRPGPGHPESSELRRPLSWVIAGSLLLFLLITGGMIAAFVGGRGFRAAPELVAENDAPQETRTEMNSAKVDQSVLDSVEKPAEPPPEPVSEPNTDDAPHDMAREEPITVPLAPEPAISPLPLADVINVHKEHLPLPAAERNRTLTGGASSALTEAAHLAEIYVDDREKVTLRIEGQEGILSPGVQFAITEELSPDRSMKIWEINETNPTGVAAVGTKVGQFRLHNNKLSFQWQYNLQSSKLQFCRLIIEATNSAGSQQANCTLFEPFEQPPLNFDFENAVHSIDLNLDPRSLPRLEHLRMDVVIRGIHNSQYKVSGNSLTLTSPDDTSGGITIDFYRPAGRRRPEDRIVRTGIQLAADVGTPPRLIMRNFAFHDQVRFDKQQRGGLPPDVEVGPPTDPVEFARSSEERVRREALNLLSELRRYKSQLQDVIAARRQKYSSVSEARSSNAGRTQRAITRVKAELDEAEKLEEQYTLAEVVLARIDDRLTELSAIHQQLEQNVQVDIHLYLMHDGTPTDIMRTRQRAALP